MHHATGRQVNAMHKVPCIMLKHMLHSKPSGRSVALLLVVDISHASHHGMLQGLDVVLVS